MSTPFPQSSLDQAARDAAANKPQNVLDYWKKKIMQMPGFQKPAPAPTSSQAQTARDAKAGAEAIRKLNAAKTGASLVGGSVAGAVTAPLILGGSEDASIKWRRLGYSSPEAYQKAVSQNANRERPISSDYAGKFADLRGSVTPGSMEPAATNLGEGIQMQIAERHRAGAGYPDGVTRPGYYPVQSNGGSGGSVTTTNANGVTQTMKPMSSTSAPIDMSRSFNDLLGSVNKGQFSSNQLPTTAGSPDSNIGPVADGQEYANNLGRQGTKGIGPVADGQVYGNMLGGGRVKGDQNIGPVANGQEYAESLGEVSDIDPKMARRRAFLDADDSFSGLRAVEKLNGVVYAGGQHYVAGESADSPAVAIKRSAARDISNGKETAAGASQKAQDLLKKKTADVVAAVKQAPTELQSAASSQAFKQDNPMSATMPGDIGGKAEYYSNNDNVIEPFGGPKGYKSGFKRIDTSMPNAFGG